MENKEKRIKRYKERFFAFLLIAGLIFAFFVLSKKNENKIETATVEIGDAIISVEIADTSEERALGLGGRNSIGDAEGMFFVFEEPGMHAFWMKNMEFSLDIIWIGEDFKVVDMKENISPDTYPQQYASSLRAQYVLEVNAGFIQSHSITANAPVIFER